MRVPNRMFPHRNLIAYRPKLGEGAYGPEFGELVVVPRGAIDDDEKLVRLRGELVSTTRVAIDLEHHVPAGSEVTVWHGTPRARTATVLRIAIADWPRLPKFQQLTLE